MLLTRDNYYTPEADREFMSCSQYQAWNACEAREMAKLEGRWQDEPSEAFTVGNYFHTHFESPEAHEQFCRENCGEIYKTKTVKGETVVTGKRAPFERADAMIAAAEQDELISALLGLEGENEKIMQGSLFGVPWRIRLDKYVPDGRMIIDYKTCASITELKYSEEQHSKVTFIDAHDYIMRAAVYSEIEKQYAGQETDPEFLIIAISKQDPPDKEVLRLNHRSRYDYELEKIKARLPMIQAVREGAVRPRRCGRCDYCRATKKLFAIKPYYVLMPQFREGPEDEYEQGTPMDSAPAEGELEQLPAVRSAAGVGES